MISKEEIDHLKQRLLKEKQEIETKNQHGEHDEHKKSFPYDSFGELSAYDNHPGDQGTELFERGKDIALEDLEREHKSDIDEALTAIDQGIYGICKVCGLPIDEERLKALPTAITCTEHSKEQSVSQTRPIEEKWLSPPSGQFESEESAAYDGEDAYQDLERYGNSETPSDMEFPPLTYDDVYTQSEDEDYVEDYEGFAASDLYGKEMQVFPTKAHEAYEDALDEEGIMTVFGDLKPYEKDPYIEEKE
ncbi:TraR/DksA C4-type zinc finger protein [Bacillus sp. NPDC077027]|uniref:TraR/DksA C4-type zinc finger protein n=1 Tax=Bacillus sp. NPDC077027 TaxID=3390548 RepID=UPI003D047025